MDTSQFLKPPFFIKSHLYIDHKLIFNLHSHLSPQHRYHVVEFLLNLLVLLLHFLQFLLSVVNGLLSGVDLGRQATDLVQ